MRLAMSDMYAPKAKEKQSVQRGRFGEGKLHIYIEQNEERLTHNPDSKNVGIDPPLTTTHEIKERARN